MTKALCPNSKAPIGCHWIYISKGDDEKQEYRSRLVAEEMNPSPSAEMSAATPPSQAKKMLFSMAVADFAKTPGIKSRGNKHL